MAVIQKDIARQLDLSVATVSRSLRQDPRIPSETRAKVVSFASKAGYRPKTKNSNLLINSACKTDAKKESSQSFMLAVFVQVEHIAEAENSYKTLAGISQAAQEHNSSMVLHTVGFDRRDQIHLPENQPEVMGSGKIQGVILLQHFEEESVQKLSTQTACVSIQHYHPEVHMDCVSADNIQAVAKLVEYLRSLGHKKIGYIDETYTTSFFDERLSGYILGLVKSNLKFAPEYIMRKVNSPGEKDRESKFDILHRWIGEGVTALMCANDSVAFDVYRWLRKHSYQCPQQVSVTGFDGMVCPADIPALTSVRVHFPDLGRLAVEQLVSRLKEPTLPPVRTMVECELIEGKTAGRR